MKLNIVVIHSNHVTKIARDGGNQARSILLSMPLELGKRGLRLKCQVSTALIIRLDEKSRNKNIINKDILQYS